MIDFLLKKKIKKISFFLSETLKYLYLAFDEENELHHRPIVFSTEGHPFDAERVRRWAPKKRYLDMDDVKVAKKGSRASLLDALHVRRQLAQLEIEATRWPEHQSNCPKDSNGMQ